MASTKPIELQEDQIAEVMTALATGDSLAKISKRIGISIVTLWKITERDKEVALAYTRAKEQKAQFLAEEIVDIADNPELKAEDKRIMVDARKWVAGKYYGKLFGDKIQTEHSGSIEFSGLSDEQLDARIKAMMGNI